MSTSLLYRHGALRAGVGLQSCSGSSGLGENGDESASVQCEKWFFGTFVNGRTIQ